MDEERFDSLARAFAVGTSRRSILRLALGGIGSAALAIGGARQASGAARIGWPFATTDGQWAVVSGYRNGGAHNRGEADEFALDMAKCPPDNVQSDGTCAPVSGWREITRGATVYAPVSGTLEWGSNGCAGGGIIIDGYPDYRIELIHIDLRPGLPATTWAALAQRRYHFTQGEPIGTVSQKACQGIGDHIHMALYRRPDGNDRNRIAVPFDGEWGISGCPFPNVPSDPRSRNLHIGKLIPCGQQPAKPRITAGPTVGDIRPTSARVTWTTNEATTGAVDYGQSTRYGKTRPSPESTVRSRSHDILLTSLTPGKRYHFRVRGTTAAGSPVSATGRFRTPSCSGNAVPCDGTCVQTGTAEHCRRCNDRCDDGNPCTLSTCVRKSRCDHLPLPDGEECGPDGETCQAGVCRPPAQESVTVTVPAGEKFGQPTGLTVTTGQVVSFQSTGRWCWGGDPEISPDCCDADGTSGRPNPEEQLDALLPDGRLGQMAGKILASDGEWVFLIGQSATLTMERTGELLLLMNDRACCYGDNSLTITVQVNPTGAAGDAPLAASRASLAPDTGDQSAAPPSVSPTPDAPSAIQDAAPPAEPTTTTTPAPALDPEPTPVPTDVPIIDPTPVPTATSEEPESPPAPDAAGTPEA